MMKIFLTAGFIMLASTATAQQLSLEQRLKNQLGELVFTNSVCLAQMDAATTQNNTHLARIDALEKRLKELEPPKEK